MRDRRQRRDPDVQPASTSCARTLDGLAAQTRARRAVEVDRGVRRLDRRHRRVPRARRRCPLPVVALRQANAGPAAARNRGVDAATRRPRRCSSTTTSSRPPTCVAAHVRHHGAAGRRPRRDRPDAHARPTTRSRRGCGGSRTCCTSSTTRWSAATGRRRRGSSTPATRRSPAVTCVAAGGFDPAFRRAEDVELAYRLADRGLRFAFDAGRRRRCTTPSAASTSWLDNAYAYGRNDVIFGRDHGQRWLLDAIATEFHGRHRLVRGADPDLPRRDRGCDARRSACSSGRRPGGERARRRPVARPALERGLQPRVLPGHGRRARRRPTRCSRRFDGAGAHVSERCAPRVGFVLEQTLGHITHADNLRAPRRRRPRRSTPSSRRSSSTSTAGRRGCPATATGRSAPGSGPGGRSAGCARGGPLDALFVHTQVPAILVARPRAADPDGRVARRHADPVRRARRALRPRHRRAARSSG